jgi:hypothetical protein
MKSRSLCVSAVLVGGVVMLYAQTHPNLSDPDKAISTQIGKLRNLSDAEWTQAVGQLAREIQELAPGAGKTSLIGRFSNLVTEGDAGHEILQIVASTIADVLRDSPNAQMEATLAQLVRYEHIERFRPQGLVILAVSDEEIAKVQPFIAERKYTYPILLDPGRHVNELFVVEGIPKSFLFNRDGKLVAEAMDRRTETQFLAMLKQAGIQ